MVQDLVVLDNGFIYLMSGASLQGGWDLISFIFFGFVMYKACTKHWREIIISYFKRKRNLAKTIVICLAVFFLLITWFMQLIEFIKLF